jgi:hypothetical protein
MINSNDVGCVNQHKQIHMGIHIYHVCNMLSNLIIMLDFLIITNMLTHDVSSGVGAGVGARGGWGGVGNIVHKD